MIHPVSFSNMITLRFIEATSQFAPLEKINQIFSFLTVLVPLWFIIISLVLLYLSKLLFSGFLQSTFCNISNSCLRLSNSFAFVFLPNDRENKQ